VILQEIEILILVLGLLYLPFHRKAKESIAWCPELELFFFPYWLMMAGWAATILEGIFFYGLFNLLENICYTAAGVTMARATFFIAKRCNR